MQTENGVSRKDPLKKDARFLPFFELYLVGKYTSLGKNSSQYRNAAAHLLRSSFLRVVSTLLMFLERGGCCMHGIVCVVLRRCGLWIFYGVVMVQDQFELGE